MIRLFLAAVLLPLSVPAIAADLPDAELIHYINGRIDSGEYIGLIVGFVDGDNTYVQAFGRKSVDGDVPPDARTLFEISSISKTFAATLLADAIVDGDMALSDPANDHLDAGTEFAGHEGREITLLDLVSHQSSLPYMPTDTPKADGPNPYADTNADDMRLAINSNMPASPAGQGYSYSAFAYGAIAHLLVEYSGATVADMVQSGITGPLGMQDTVMQPNEEQAGRMATGYTPDGEIAVPLDQGVFQAAGSMYSTLDDLMVWLQANMSGTNSALNEAIAMTHPLRNEMGTIGMAWHRKEGFDDRSQFGTAHGYRAYVGFLADGTKGAVVLANTKANVLDIGERLILGLDLPAPE